MTETKIKGLKILLDNDYIEIIDAYQINNKQKMIEVIEETINKMKFFSEERDIPSMVKQWAFTNRMYRWHIFRKKNSKCIITNKVSKIKKLLYTLLGFQQIRIAKIKKRLEKKKMSDISLGTLYDVNKNLVLKNEIELTDGVVNSKKEIITNFMRQINNTYYMLLCNEKKDYTVFRMNDKNSDDSIREIVSILVDECLKNRGEIRGIDLTKDKDAIEIWLIIEDEAYCYYFFPYDAAIVEV
ncbi:MAG: hypothetical protein IJV94_04195 [Bacilli bacterium]|nr:hypothetical protein [Bacilli bacterium]